MAMGVSDGQWIGGKNWAIIFQQTGLVTEHQAAVVHKIGIEEKCCWYAFFEQDGRDHIMAFTQTIIETEVKHGSLKSAAFQTVLPKCLKINRLKVPK